jgi:hypothetical protein
VQHAIGSGLFGTRRRQFGRRDAGCGNNVTKSGWLPQSLYA